MNISTLNGKWKLNCADKNLSVDVNIPGSVYDSFIKNNLIPDPYYRDNEKAAYELMQHDFIFSRGFNINAEQFSCDKLQLRCFGIDTIGNIYINNKYCAYVNNMHRTWFIDIKDLVKIGENEIKIELKSPLEAAQKAFEEVPVQGSEDAVRGFPRVRKAHYMYGWDWGARLPDAGIWQDIEVIAYNTARLDSVLIRQNHNNGKVELNFKPYVIYAKQNEEATILQYKTNQSANDVFEEIANEDILTMQYSISSPVNKNNESSSLVLETNNTFKAGIGNISYTVNDPQLWWPNTLGDQPLYTIKADLKYKNCILDTKEYKVGLRTLTVSTAADEWGKEFAFCVNGIKFFAMGADYIPEDNILSRVNRDRTKELLQECVNANFNSIRVWGGGLYASEVFYETCDELGLVVWQDFLFACAIYQLDAEFEENVTNEFIDNIKRIANHASLGLLCGNNEMEQFVKAGEWNVTKDNIKDYLILYERILPNLCAEFAPDTFYWPSSPSSGGSFDYPQDENRGDVHFWAVWHGNKPFNEYQKHYFRFLSEFGFQSFPSLKTIESFTDEKDRNIFSYVMEKHQRSGVANGKILNYLTQTYQYPKDFDSLLYASQLLQAEAIRYGVEHFRRYRGRCMGAIYWQLNDCWPVASWSSIDYFGRWKALHYMAKRFFEPKLLSCVVRGPIDQLTNINIQPIDIVNSVKFNISNESLETCDFTIKWQLRDKKSLIIKGDEINIQVSAQSTVWFDEMDFSEVDPYEYYISYSLWENGICISDESVLFCAPKHFKFEKPSISIERNDDKITISSDCFVKYLEVCCEDGDMLFSDNYFDMNSGSKTIKIAKGTGSKFKVRSVFDISGL